MKNLSYAMVVWFSRSFACVYKGGMSQYLFTEISDKIKMKSKLRPTPAVAVYTLDVSARTIYL